MVNFYIYYVRDTCKVCNFARGMNKETTKNYSVMTMVCRLLVVLLFFFSSKAYAQQTDSVPQPQRRPWLIALKTNLLYDAAVIPNIGIEISLGKRFTISADWFYTWFSSDNRHRYWQGYGGYLTVRKYFGGNKHQTSDLRPQTSLPFTGHHLGLYGLGMTYDVEWGGRGYQAARFGFGGGVEYGYSARIGRRLCLDFNLGLGFQDGEYKEYLPTDDGTGHYVWQSTHKRHWWGPTKAEVTLKWILGPLREKKGGAR